MRTLLRVIPALARLMRRTEKPANEAGDPPRDNYPMF